MNKSILAVSALALAISGCGEKNINLLEKVDQNTSVVFTSQFNDAMISAMNTSAGSLRNSQANIAQFADMMFNEQSATTVKHLFAQLTDVMISGPQGLKLMGMDNNAQMVSYLDGLTPVVRVAVADKAAWWSFVSTLIGTGEAQTYASGNYRVLALQDQNDETIASIYFTDAEGEGAIIIDVIKEGLPRIASIMKGVAIDQSIAKSGKIAKLQKDYSLNSTLTGFISFEQIVKDIYLAKGSQLGRDIAANADNFVADVKSEPFQACKADVQSLVSGVPQLVFGYENIAKQQSSVQHKGAMILEIKNPAVVKSLTKMDGYLPNYALNDHGQALSFGVGVNVAQLTPALTELWTQFTSKDYTCPALIEAKQEAMRNSPAMLSMATAMVQNIQGAGLSLIDFTVSEDENSPFPAIGLDAVVSVSGQNMGSTASMLPMMVPQFAGLSLEVDGDAVQVPDLIPFLNQDVYAQLTANHLVMFTGEQAKPVAEKALNDGLKTNGHFATTYSTKKISQVADTLFAQAPVLANFIPFDSAQCNEAYVTLSGLAGYDQVGTYRSYMNETGMVGHASTMTMLNDVKPYALAAGTYTAAQYSFGCQLEDVYSLTLNADGKAMAEGEALTWALVDNALEISNDGETEACILLSQSDSGFACVSHDGYMGSTVTHYTKQ